VRDLIISLPLVFLGSVLLIFFFAVGFAGRALVRRRCGAEACEDIGDQASNLLGGVAAEFAFFVGFAITVTWGAVSAAQAAVEQQAASIQQMAWKINNISNQAESAALRDKLGTYATTAANSDADFLIRGDTANLPSTVLHIYAFGPNAKPQEVNSLVTAAATIGTNAATVSAVAQRALPGVLAVLLMITGVLVAVVTGIATLTSKRPVVFLVWGLIPALSISVVLALAFPFAPRIGVSLAPLHTVAENLTAR